jgi:hypothetical protein
MPARFDKQPAGGAALSSYRETLVDSEIIDRNPGGSGVLYEGFSGDVPKDFDSVVSAMVASVLVCDRRSQGLQEAFNTWRDGLSLGQYAEAEGISRDLAYKRREKALRLMLPALESYYQSYKPQPDPSPEFPPLERHRIASWFSGFQPEHILDMAVLLVFYALSDKSRKLSVSTAYYVLPPVIVTHSLPRLRWRGFLKTNGIDIEIVKVPGDTDA